MILSVILPIAMAVVAMICLLGAFFPSTFSRGLLMVTGFTLIGLTGWYVSVFFLGVF